MQRKVKISLHRGALVGIVELYEDEVECHGLQCRGDARIRHNALRCCGEEHGRG